MLTENFKHTGKCKLPMIIEMLWQLVKLAYHYYRQKWHTNNSNNTVMLYYKQVQSGECLLWLNIVDLLHKIYFNMTVTHGEVDISGTVHQTLLLGIMVFLVASGT